MKTNIDLVIEGMLESHYGPLGRQRQKYLFRQSLLALVRLAQAEQLRDIRINARRLTTCAPTEKMFASDCPQQGQLEFGALNNCRPAREREHKKLDR